MKILNANSIILLSIVMCLIACSEDSKEETKYRNQNFIWFVIEGESEGNWIEIDYSQGSKLLKYGHCTTFYESGTERSKYNLDQRGKQDTVFYFDLNDHLTHYSIGVGDNVQNYFYHEGEFESFLADGSMAISGIIKDHDLIEYEWHGAMADLQILMSSKKQIWADYLEINGRISTAIRECTESGARHISQQLLIEIDSLRMNILDSTIITSTMLQNHRVADVSYNVKEKTIKLVEATRMMLEEDCKKFIQSMHLEFNSENLNTLRSLAQSYDDKNKELDQNFHSELSIWTRQTQPGNYTIPYMAEYLAKKYR